MLAGLLEHPGDQGDVHDVELQRAGAGGVGRRRAVGADQAQQPVDGAHPRPGQRDVQQPGRVDPDWLCQPELDLDLAHIS